MSFLVLRGKIVTSEISQLQPKIPICDTTSFIRHESGPCYFLAASFTPVCNLTDLFTEQQDNIHSSRQLMLLQACQQTNNV